MLLGTLVPVGTVFPYSLSPVMLFACLQFVANFCCIALPGIFLRRRLPGCCPREGWLAQRSTVYRIFYRASATLLETALHTVNIKCNGTFPGAVQERLGSLHDHSFVALYTPRLCTSSSRTRDTYCYIQTTSAIDFHEKSSKRTEPLVIWFEIMLLQFRSNESWGAWNQCKSNTCVFSFILYQ